MYCKKKGDDGQALSYNCQKYLSHYHYDYEHYAAKLVYSKNKCICWYDAIISYLQSHSYI